MITQAPVDVTTALLEGWPLPQPEDGDGKDGRGRVLVVAGAEQTPGSARLAVDAALRAGAGRVTLATEKEIAPGLALALPEARVITLAELRGDVMKADCVLIGPGMRNANSLVERVLQRSAPSPVILDACAMNVLRGRGKPLRGRVLITPHAGELAHLGVAVRETIEREPERYAHLASEKWNVAVALKGAETVVVADGILWRHRGGNPGLGISGSGDVLAGLIAGLTARCGDLAQAAVWGVALHARAGERLARRIGPLGYLARELAAEVPPLMRDLAAE